MNSAVVKELLLGCHVGYKQKNYLLGSVTEAISYGANCFMVFSGPPQNFVRKPIEPTLVAKAHALMAQKKMLTKNIVVHAPYLINLASPRPTVVPTSIQQLIVEVERTAQFGANLLVLHPGSCLTSNRQTALLQIAKGLNEVFAKTKKTANEVIVCIETMAGKGSEVGISFAEIAMIINNVKDQQRIGVCFDTCHLHDAGYDLTNVAKVLADFEKHLAFDYLKVIHLNDSKNPINAKKDRHANIGYGQIGFKTLLEWTHHPKLAHVPKILETPWRDNLPVYQQEIHNLKTKKFVAFETNSQ